MSIPRNLSIIADTLNADGTFFTITDTGNLTFTGTGNRITGDFSSTPTSRVAFQTSTVNGNTNIEVIPNGTATTTALNLESDPALTNGTFFQLGLNGGTDARLTSAIRGTGTYLPMTFYTGGSERMRLDTSGRLGVGVTSINTSFIAQFNGGIGLGSPTRNQTTTALIGVRTSNDPADDSRSSVLFGTTAGAASSDSYIAFNTNQYGVSGGERVRIDPAGNVGIGTSSPTANTRLTLSDVYSSKLTITGGSTQNGMLLNAVSTSNQYYIGSGVNLLNSGDKGILIYDVTNARAKFFVEDVNGETRTLATTFLSYYTGASERMRIDSSGNVGIGTTSPGTYGRFAVVSNGDYAPSATFISNSSAANWARADWKNVNVAYNGIIYQENGGSFNIRNDGANAIVFQTTATERMRIDASGNVGIGNSSPGGFRLNVTGSIYQTDGYATFGQYNAGTSGTSPVAGGISFSTNITSGNAESDVWNGNDPASYANTGILFTQRLTSTTRRDLMFLHNSGNVGIGTNSPAGRLDVRTAAGVVAQSNLYTGSNASVVKFNIGQIGAVDWDIGLSASSGNFYIGGLGGTMAEAYRITRTGAAIDFQTWNTGGSERMRIDSSGNVNIGSASTTAAAGGRVFDIYNLENTNSSSYALARLITYNVAGTTSVSADIFKNKAGSFVFNNNETNAAANTSFGVGGSERMRIDSSGNLLVGTTATSNITKLTTYNAGNAFIAANTATSNLTTPAMQVSKGDNNTTTSNVLVQFLTNGFVTGQGQINANGSSAAAFGSFSDKRLKENIVDLPSQLEKIMALRPVEFDYVESIGGGHQIGFIAQEVQTIYPDLVGVGENEMLTLTDLNKNDARLIKCIQEQQALITSLTARITALEST
jgi:hypothetical protein